MPKLFRTIFFNIALAAASFASANDELCPAPQKVAVDISTIPQPNPEELHAAMQAAVNQANTTLDWVNDPNSDSLCGGYYQEYPNPNPQQDVDPDFAELYLSADSAEKAEDGFTTLSGNVELYHGTRRLRCDTMRYSDSTQYSDVSGNIQVRQPGLLLMSETANFDNLQKNSRFTATEYVLHQQQAHGKAGVINLNASNQNAILTLEKTSFTICPPSAELWSFDARKLEIDYNEGWGKMYSAFFQVADVPIFYLPYLDFPIDRRRKTGLLWPTFSSSNHGGIDMTLPYYFNLAPQADLTYILRHNSDHGTLHGAEARYLNTFSEWSMGGTYLGNDDRVGGISIKNDPTLDNKRWLGFVKESGRFNANWSTQLDYQAVSDMNYFRDWGANGLDVQKSLNIRRFATLNFTNDQWRASTTVIDYETLELDPLTQKNLIEDYRRLPTINVLYRNNQENFTLHPVLFSQYTFFDHEQRIRSHRFFMEPGIQYPMRWLSGEIIPTVRMKYREYNLNESNDISEVLQPNTVFQGKHETATPTLTLNNRLFFERQTELAGQSYTQTLTPRLYYYYADYEDQSYLPNFDTIETAFSYQQLFRDTRFGSFDRIGDANQLSFALESAFIKDSNGNKLFSVGIGQIAYFQNRRVTAYEFDNIKKTINPGDTNDIIKEKQLINHEIDKRYYRDFSDVAIEPNWYINRNQRLSSSVIWDPYSSTNQETAIGYHYIDDDRRIFNATYRYKRNPYYNAKGNWFTLNDIDQTDLSVFWPVHKNWHAYMRWNYDITNNNTIEDITGVKYEGCCIGVMFAYQRERKTFDNNIRLADSLDPTYTNTWFIQFELKGLGGITNTITTLLEESIQGFKQRENNL